MESTSRRKVSAWSAPSSPARAMKARMSLGRQPPPKPMPARRNFFPMRSSWPIASASFTTSPSAASQTSAMALMNEILVARKELAEVFTSSAVGKSVTTNGDPSATGTAYTSRSSFSARSLSTPTTIRSGCSVSLTAKPSRRNSGFQASSAPSPTGASSMSRAASRAAEPTGTVDLPTTRAGLVRSGASESKALLT